MKQSSWAHTLVPGDAEPTTHVTGLPPDLLAQAARRLRVVTLLYAFVFFMSDPLPALLFSDDRAAFFASSLEWAPSVLSISIALLVATLTSSPRLPATAVLWLGPVFEVVASLGIATAEFLDGSRYTRQAPLSWVAVWMLAYTIIVPSRPRRALVAALLSASTVPLVVGSVMAAGRSAIQLNPTQFFFALVLPYLLVVLMAYVGARVVYNLGTELERARQLGSYRLVERLGAGGMGEVWRARHQLLARPAAIKLIRPEVLGDSSPGRASELRARFEREAQATASLRSPHTIELYDFGVAGDGSFYYVMEFLDGFDLDTLVRQFGPVPPERAVYLLKQVCHSLAEAHAEGLIHRDIKPANVYVCRYGREADFVKVLDFGLVKSQHHEGDGNATLTADHTARGTPAFMSPEQVLGNRPLDGRSDIYSTGCLAYWLMTGHHLFRGSTVMETMLQHAHEKAPPVSQRTEFAIPKALDELILECLEKNPDERPATADLLAARLLAIETTAAWTPDLARQWWQTHEPAG